MTTLHEIRRMSTSTLVKLVARGASSPELQEALEAELDRRVRPSR